MAGRRRDIGGGSLAARVAGWPRKGIVRSIQRGSITLTAGLTTATATITAVSLANAVIAWSGNTYDAASGDFALNQGRIRLTNATTVTANRNTAGNVLILGFEVIEYWPGIVRQVQHDIISVAGASATYTITPAVRSIERTSVRHLGVSSNVASNANPTDHLVRVVVTNTTTVTATRGAAAAGTSVVSICVVEWF